MQISLSSLIAVGALTSAINTSAAPCIRVGHSLGAGTSPPVDSFDIPQPGSYCLTENIASRRKYVPSEGGEQGSPGPIGHIGASRVTLDLRDHELIANAQGEWGISSGNKQRELVANVTVKNGTIQSRTSWGIRFIDAFRWDLASTKDDFFTSSTRVPILKEADEEEYRSFVALKKMLRTQFPLTNHRLEALHISASYQPVEIRGAGNLIKACQIESTQHGVGIDVSGPNQIIENSTIVVQAEPGRRAAIVLKMADNSIIRNNTIVIEGWGDKPDAAISIIDSKNVVIENNKIIGVKQLYKIWDEEPDQKSSVVEHGNEFASGWSRLFGK